MARLNIDYDLLTWEGDILRLKFWAQAKYNSRPRMISTCIVTMKSVLTSRSMAINEKTVLALSGMAASYRLPTKQGVKAHDQPRVLRACG